MNQLIDENVECRKSILGNNIWIRAETKLNRSTIGDDVFINFRCQIQDSIIGDHTQIASNTKIKSAIIGNNCWIGSDSCIYGKVHVGNNVVIGAHTVVSQDIPDNSVVYGRDKLEIKERNFENNGFPDFKLALEKNLKLKNLGSYLREDESGNYISADFIGQPSKIGYGNILIGNSVTNGFIKFGKNVKIGNGNILEGAGQIEIGNNSWIGNNVHIVSNSHDYHYSKLPMTFAPVIIGSSVVIKDSAIILAGVTIPDKTIVDKSKFVRKF
ncbi:DapH/DapD/GlmU-related protein [Lactococcus lactis]|uniref:DapH/DapD/GlmU-related protein n=1 Tax=Lactococcus lactis TaxID=1358 RepID=UPI001F578C45|nr:hypothetical protein [Lactococcus lactis]